MRIPFGHDCFFIDGSLTFLALATVAWPTTHLQPIHSSGLLLGFGPSLLSQTFGRRPGRRGRGGHEVGFPVRTSPVAPSIPAASGSGDTRAAPWPGPAWATA